jgi:hypothetical protein
MSASDQNVQFGIAIDWQPVTGASAPNGGYGRQDD